MSSPSSPAPYPRWKAIAAMAENRVIGIENRIPWHLPEDFKWFKQCTLGNVVVFGRKTFVGLGKPLPGRTNLVLTRNPAEARQAHRDLLARSTATLPEGATPGRPNVAPAPLDFIESLEELRRRDDPCDVFICGGAQIYEAAFPLCEELLLTRVKRTVAGDAFLPPFEHLFDFVEVIRETPDFVIERWRRHSSTPPIP